MEGQWIAIEIQINDTPTQVSDGTTVAQLLAQLNKQQHVAVELTMEVVHRREHGDVVLRPGDQVELVTLVGGG
ncbi:MAG: sulfur carrier protein ThiS [Pirellulaceae bacterium]